MTNAPHASHNRFFAAWARVVIRLRVPLLIATLGLTALAAWNAKTNLRIEASLESLASQDSEVARTLETFRDTFGRDDVFLVLAAGDVFTMDYLNRLAALHKELASINLKLESVEERLEKNAARTAADTAAATAAGDAGFDDFALGDGDNEDAAGWGEEKGGTIVDEMVSLINVRKVRSDNGAPVFGELLDPFPTQDQLATVREEALAERSIVGQLIGPRAQHSVLLVRTFPMTEEDTGEVYAEIERIIAGHQAPGFELSIAGVDALKAVIKGRMLADLKVLLSSSIAIMLLVLAWLFRHPLGVVAPLIVVVTSVVWTFGAMALFGAPMTLVTNILPSFLICVGMGAAIHLVTVYRDHRHRGVDTHEAVERAVAETGLPLVFTTLTTMMGLLSFRLADLEAIAEMGTAGAFGVSVALLNTLVFLPAALSFNRGGVGKVAAARGPDRLDRFLAFCVGISGGDTAESARRRRRRTLAGALLLAVLAGMGISQLRVAHDPLAWFPSDDTLRLTSETIDREIGGAANVQLFVEATGPKGVKDLAFLRGLEALQDHIAAYVGRFGEGSIVGHSHGILDVVKETNRALHAGDPKWYRLPDTDRGVADAINLFSDSRRDSYRRIVASDQKTTQVTIRIKWLDANSYAPLAAWIDAGVRDHLGGLARVRVTGGAYTMLSIVSGLVMNVLRSFGAAFIVITLFMIVLLRRLPLGLVSMVPNLLPIAMILGLMGALDIPIDMGNLMLASIAIGIAVDDTIHFLHHFRMAQAAGQDTEAAIRSAVEHSGRAMVSTSTVLALGFLVFLAASMLHLQRFGSLIAVTAVFALLVDVIIAPALLRSLYGGGRDAKR